MSQTENTIDSVAQELTKGLDSKQSFLWKGLHDTLSIFGIGAKGGQSGYMITPQLQEFEKTIIQKRKI